MDNPVEDKNIDKNIDKNRNKKIDRNTYIKTDNNTIINENCIRWVKKYNECLEICTKVLGCDPGKDTHKVCKDSYNKLNVFFK